MIARYSIFDFMKRRNFITNLSLGTAGIGIASSCSGPNEDKATSQAQGVESVANVEPAYKKQIKSSFQSANTKGNGDKVILALIGAGNWGTNLITNVIDIEKNVEVKYICDVDDTRGWKGHEGSLSKARFQTPSCQRYEKGI